MENTKNTITQPLLLTIPQVAASLCLGRTKVYELIDVEGLPVVRFGRAIKSLSSIIERMVRSAYATKCCLIIVVEPPFFWYFWKRGGFMWPKTGKRGR